MDEDNELYLTNIVLYEENIIEAIHELATSSAAGLIFLIMLADINKDISESNLISFADNTQIYIKIDIIYIDIIVTDCNTLQQDLNHVYD